MLFYLNRVHHAYCKCNFGDLYIHASECFTPAILQEQILGFREYTHLSVQRLCSKYANKPQLSVSTHFNVKKRKLGCYTHNLLEPCHAWDCPCILEQKPFAKGSQSASLSWSLFLLLPTKIIIFRKSASRLHFPFLNLVTCKTDSYLKSKTCLSCTGVQTSLILGGYFRVIQVAEFSLPCALKLCLKHKAPYSVPRE